MNMTKNRLIPLFDTLENVKSMTIPRDLSDEQQADFEQAHRFLLCYADNTATFNTYRREIERLLQWCQYHTISFKQIRRDDYTAYIKFCQKPLKSWIATKTVSRFTNKDGKRSPNPEWRPFVATVTKAQANQGKHPKPEDYVLSQKSLREIFSVSNSFFNFLIQENYLDINPVAQIRQKNKYFTKQQTKKVIRKLSELQWGYVIETAHLMAEKDEKHERTLFIMNSLYAMYLRISELVTTERWAPQMRHFERDGDGLWWFTTVGKGNKERQIAVSAAMIKALTRWRKYLELSPLPSPGETHPLIPKQLGTGPITSDRPIRKIVQQCFDQSVARLKTDGLNDDAQQLANATVHWLRHTGISDDVKARPREHVRDDAGHSSSLITDRYVDVGLRERHQTAKKKTIVPEAFKEDVEKI